MANRKRPIILRCPVTVEERKLIETVFMEKHCPCGNRNAAGLHLQICLYEGWQNRLYVVVDLMRSAFWSASNVPLDRSQ